MILNLSSDDSSQVDPKTRDSSVMEGDLDTVGTDGPHPSLSASCDAVDADQVTAVVLALEIKNPEISSECVDATKHTLISDSEEDSDSDSGGYWVPRAPSKHQMSSKAKKPEKKRDPSGQPAGGEDKEKKKQPPSESKEPSSQSKSESSHSKQSSSRGGAAKR